MVCTPVRGMGALQGRCSAPQRGRMAPAGIALKHTIDGPSDTLARMPEVIIEIAQGRTQDQKRALIKEITEAVVRTCSVPADAVTVIIHENPLTDKGKGGVLFSER
jgi:4-oxalocrotonate tautomerase